MSYTFRYLINSPLFPVGIQHIDFINDGRAKQKGVREEYA